jgi:hypothetical protein
MPAFLRMNKMTHSAINEAFTNRYDFCDTLERGEYSKYIELPIIDYEGMEIRVIAVLNQDKDFITAFAI